MDESYVICSVKKILPVLLILCASLSPLNSNNFSAQKSLPIRGTWICLDSTEISVPGWIPGSLYNSLLRSSIIPDPFIGTNEDSVQWISKMDWVFTSDPFDAPENIEDYDLLILKDVQLYCSITLNGVVLGETNNAFRNWSYSLKSSLKPTDNIVTFNFESPTHSANKMGSVEQHRTPQFAFGWDWALKLIDFSVGRIELAKSRPEANIYIDNLTLVTDTIYGSTAKGFVKWDISGDLSKAVVLRWALTNESGTVVASENFSKIPGVITSPFTIEKADLWWTHDLGKPSLHTLEVVAVGKNGLLALEKKTVGIRTFKLDTSEDDIGAKFKWILNNVPFFAGGANVVPADIIKSRISSLEERAIVRNAVAANMNTLRVWGGGNYASDDFMEACDEMGVLVWQDFMFACAMYPGNEAFLESVEHEALDQILRLRHHPSLAMWCGNNEVSEGWERWGWQDGLSEEEITNKEKAYSDIFDDILPSTVSLYADAPYWPSSPMLGRGDPDFKNRGDAHDWGIWHDGYSFDSLWARIPRFMSEFGFQSFPERSTWETVVMSDTLDRLSSEVISHEKHSRGFAIIDKYLESSYGDYSDGYSYEEWAYITQVLQAKGISDGVRAARLNQDFCSGSLVWQLNDCWPVASWSSIDAHGKWKLLHHELKKAFAPTLLYGKWNHIGRKPSLEIGLVANPSIHGEIKIPGTVLVSVVNFDGTIVYMSEHPLNLTPGQAQWISLDKVPYFNNRKNIDPTSSYVQLSWIDDTCENPQFCPIKASATVFAALPKELKLEDVPVIVKPFTGGNKDSEFVLYEVSSSAFTKDVQLAATTPGNFEMNGFDLLPGEKRIVKFTPHSLRAWAPELFVGGTSKLKSKALFVRAISLNNVIKTTSP
jgi:beta-mannosidase